MKWFDVIKAIKKSGVEYHTMTVDDTDVITIYPNDYDVSKGNYINLCSMSFNDGFRFDIVKGDDGDCDWYNLFDAQNVNDKKTLTAFLKKFKELS